MSSPDCPLHALATECPNAVLLYGTQPGLAQRVVDVLAFNRRPFRREDDFLAIPVENLRDRAYVVDMLRNHLRSVERKLIRVGQGSAAAMVAAPDLERFSAILDSSWFDEAWSQDQFRTFFQPLVDSATGEPFAYEALVRLETDRFYNGEEIINAAMLRRKMPSFDEYLRHKAILTGGERMVPGRKLFINLFPSALYAPGTCIDQTVKVTRAAGLDPARIVFELVEFDHLTDPEHTRAVCRHLREAGFGIAIDDVESGNNGLDLITSLRPDYVKIDKSIIWKLSANEGLIAGVVAASNAVGAMVVAEGIESAAMATDVRKLGIRLMQGYFFGKPAPVMRDLSLHDAAGLRELGAALRSEEPASVPEEQPAPASRLPR